MTTKAPAPNVPRPPRTDAFEDLARMAAPALPRFHRLAVAVLIVAPVLGVWVRGPAVALGVFAAIVLAARNPPPRIGQTRGVLLGVFLWSVAVVLSDPPIVPQWLGASAWRWAPVTLLAACAYFWSRWAPRPRWITSAWLLLGCAAALSAIGRKPELLWAPSRARYAESLVGVLLESLVGVLLGTGLFAAARLAAATRWWLAGLATVGALGLLAAEIPPSRLDDFEHWGWLPATAVLAWIGGFLVRAVAAARTGTAAELDVSADAAAQRAVVRFQTRPWRAATGLLVPEVILILGLVWCAGTIADAGRHSNVRFLVAGAFGGAAITIWCALPALVLQLSHGVSWSLERTAGVVVLLLGLLAAAFLVTWDELRRNAEALAAVVGVVAGPILWAWLTYWIVRKRALPTMAWLAVVVVAGIPLLRYSPDLHDSPNMLYPSMALVSLAVHQLTVSESRLPQILLLLALGALAALVSPEPSLVLGALAGGTVTLLLFIAAARRARSMTAVPLHHPIYTDFGGPRDA